MKPARRGCKARARRRRRTLDRVADLAGGRVGAARVEHGHAHAEAVCGERHHAAELPAAENADALRQRARGRRVSARHAGWKQMWNGGCRAGGDAPSFYRHQHHVQPTDGGRSSTEPSNPPLVVRAVSS